MRSPRERTCTGRWSRPPRPSVPTALTDVGFGVSQVLPALVLLLLRSGRLYGADGATGDPSPSRRAERPRRRHAERSGRPQRADHRGEPQRTPDAAPATPGRRAGGILRGREAVLRFFFATRPGARFRPGPERMGGDRELAGEVLRRRNGRDRGDRGGWPEKKGWSNPDDGVRGGHQRCDSRQRPRDPRGYAMSVDLCTEIELSRCPGDGRRRRREPHPGRIQEPPEFCRESGGGRHVLQTCVRPPVSGAGGSAGSSDAGRG